MKNDITVEFRALDQMGTEFRRAAENLEAARSMLQSVRPTRDAGAGLRIYSSCSMRSLGKSLRADTVSDAVIQYRQALDELADRSRALSNAVETAKLKFQEAEASLRDYIQGLGKDGALDVLNEAELLDYLDRIDIRNREELLALLNRLGLLNVPFVSQIYSLVDRWLKRKAVFNYAQSIQDASTRSLLLQYSDYGYRVWEGYRKADGKARQILDKYNSGVIIRDMNANDGSSYFNDDDSFRLNANSSLQDPRTAEKIFYHEYGHYIVDQNGWVYMDADGLHESESFARFHQALDREAKAYIADAEARARADLNQRYGASLTQEQIESMVHDRTVEIMRSDVGNCSDASVNGLSDIISGATNDYYRIAYGHSSSYWQARWTCQGNEGFAQFFTADVNHCEIESAFYREHFPEAYQAYQSLLDEALT